MNNRMVPRIIAIATAIVMVVVAIFSVQWKSITKAFSAPAKIVKDTEVTETAMDTAQAVEIKTPETEAAEMATTVTETSASTQASSQNAAQPVQTTVVAETTAAAPNAATATATVADGTPITVVVQMPNETLVQQPQTERQTEAEKSLTEMSDEELTKRALAATWIHYYDMDIQANGLAEDDFNFGPNPITDGQVREASYYDAELRERLKWDPALAATVTAWVDANVGTRYLGKFYEACKNDWATTINRAKLIFAADQMAYYKNLDALFRFMNAASYVEVRPCQGVTDQMYMNPYTPDGIPDVIVMETTDHSGYELVYHFAIKPNGNGSGANGSGPDNDFTVAFRINCGFQPTNVATLMDITPQPEPARTTIQQPTPQTEKGGSTPDPTPRKETETDAPDPNPHKETETDAPDPTPHTETETDAPDPTPHTETETDAPTPQTETDEPTPQTETDQPQTETDPTPQTETDPTPQTETDEPEPQTEPHTEPQTEPHTEPQTEPHTEPSELPQKNPEEQNGQNEEPNDNPGVGEDTNNGEGATTSTADQPENSDHYDSYDDYVDKTQDLEQTNEEQKVGGDSNEPSYTPPEASADEPAAEPAAVDNNGDSGNGGDNIDTPTPVEEPPVVADTGEQISTEAGQPMPEPG